MRITFDQNALSEKIVFRMYIGFMDYIYMYFAFYRQSNASFDNIVFGMSIGFVELVRCFVP